MRRERRRERRGQQEEEARVVEEGRDLYRLFESTPVRWLFPSVVINWSFPPVKPSLCFLPPYRVTDKLNRVIALIEELKLEAPELSNELDKILCHAPMA